MSYSEEYLELVDDARDALRALLRETEPGTGLNLHEAYNSLKKMSGTRASGAAEHVDHPQTDYDYVDDFKKMRDAANAWRKTPQAERERLVVELIGDKHMTINDVFWTFKETHPDLVVMQSAMRLLLKGLFDRRELVRTQPATGSRAHVYSRNTGLTGPIADLQRMIDQENS